MDPAAITPSAAYCPGPLTGRTASTEYEAGPGPESHLRSLSTLAAALRASTSLPDILELAAEEARAASGAASVSISCWERERNRERTLINVGDLGPREERYPAAEFYPLDQFPEYRLVLERRQIRHHALDDPDTDESERELLRELEKEAGVSVPIIVGDDVWGDIYATTAMGQPRFDADDETFLRSLSEYIGMAVAHAQLTDNLHRLAYEDSLTGLANRRALEDRLERLLEADVPFALALGDVDGLRALNRDHGLEAGDRALVEVAAVLRQCADGDALVARLGGDEFCVLLAEAGAAAAEELARTAVDRLQTRVEPLRMSFGVAATDLPSGGSRAPLRAADAALHLAKRTERERVSVAGAAPATAWRQAKRRGRPVLRDVSRADVAQVLTDGLASLDGAETASDPLARLAAVALRCANEVDAAAIGISFAEHGSTMLDTLFTFDCRTGHSSGVHAGTPGDVYDLREYPATAEVLERGGSAFVEDGPEADPAERELLIVWNMSAVLLVAVPGDHGTWLVELFADEATGDARGMEAALRLLGRHAVDPPGRD